MGRTDAPPVTEDRQVTLVPLLDEAKQIAYRLIVLVEMLEADLGITPDQEDDDA